MTRIVAHHPLQRIALIVWLLLLIGVTGRIAFSNPGAQSVVPIYQNGSERWLRGEDLYVEQPGLDHYRNPPCFAAAFVPFAVLPEKLAGIAWRLVSAGVFLFALRHWVRHGLPRTLTPGETGALFLLVSPLALASLNNGQTNLIVAGLLLLGATAAARSRWRSAGLWFAAAAGVKVYPLAVGLLIGFSGQSPPVAIGGRFRAYFTSLALGCLVLALFPFLCQNPDYVVEQYHSMRQSKGTHDRSHMELGRAPRDLYLVLRVWFEPPPRELYIAAKFIIAAGMAVLVWRATRTGEPGALATGGVARPPVANAPGSPALLACNLGCLWITVLGPATETHTYTILAPTSAIVLLFAFAEKSIVRRVLALIGYVLLVSPVFRDMFPNGVAWQILAPQPIGGLLLFIVVVWNALRNVKPDAAQIFSARAEALPDMIEVCRTELPHSAACSPPRPTHEATATS